MEPAVPPSDRFFDALMLALGEANVSRDASNLATYGTDWTRVYEPAPCAVARPGSTEEVASVLRLCQEHRVAVVPSGGRTGLAGGAVAANGELVLSLERMNRIHPVDKVSATVRVEAGAITEEVHRAAAAAGLLWPIDLAAKGSSRIGGNLATNAGGVRVIRYGPTREWVLGLVAVRMGGEVLRLGGALEKNNTGFDLRQLLIGSEGTLAVITEAVLKLTRPPADPQVLFFALDGPKAALRLLEESRSGPFLIGAFELLSEACLLEVERRGKGRSPLSSRAPAYVLLEVEPAPGVSGTGPLDAWLEAVLDKGLVSDGVRAQSTAQAKALWALRENITEALSHRGLVHKNDVAVPVSRLGDFFDDVERLFESCHQGIDVFLFGHVGDGNVHINVTKPEGMTREAFLEHCRRSDEELGALLQKHEGSVSAEHGIGLLKKPYLRYSRSAEELELFKAIKRAFDPLGLLNPGKIVDLT